MFQKYFSVFLVIFTALVGLYGFQTIPGFWFDEGIMAQAAKNIARYGVYGIQTAPGVFYTNNFWITTGYPVVFPTALFLKIFGISVWAARFTPFIYLILFAVVSYFLIKKLYGFKAAVLAGLLLVTFSPFYGNGKALLGEIPGLFWFVLGALFYLIYEEKNKPAYFYVSGLVLGLSVATKPYFILIVPGVALLTLFLWFRRCVDFRRFLGFWGVFSIPILIWVFFAFDFSSLPNFGATVSYFLNSYSAQTFDVFGNLFKFVSESTPIHFTVLALAVFVSFFILLKNKKEIPPITFVFLTFIILAFLWYLKTPGWYRYFFPAHIIVLLFFPASLRSLLNQFIASAAVILLIIFQAVFLFLNYGSLYGDEAMLLQKYAKENITESSSVLVDSLPEVGFVLDNDNFYQRIFISEKFEFGTSPADFTADYLVVGRSGEAGSGYVLDHEIGHYKLYRRK
ncbi:MAG: hypothetical protein A3D59_01485 [Candidatus Wildermuthbacteria bacterium RIFCSPHIGHO2_02_FULL_47_17]|uniref:Glycosyltransferase RgtA/B/C/D-like domain-containing protein n=1 Tax=Candidatus Wildermuthbacteria bacterium RIFCSPHIGHO2_02_FULL_47_17 TaxID=1802452 RepID=A0A1G2R7H1_9BACT|nr:MAG: hypothetical protein A3D59_01485 [Candidatus Wildermuthbacteria bacterium RIFCSPHIGHO2_02_FULL_47_17]